MFCQMLIYQMPGPSLARVQPAKGGGGWLVDGSRPPSGFSVKPRLGANPQPFSTSPDFPGPCPGQQPQRPAPLPPPLPSRSTVGVLWVRPLQRNCFTGNPRHVPTAGLNFFAIDDSTSQGPGTDLLCVVSECHIPPHQHLGTTQKLTKTDKFNHFQDEGGPDIAFINPEGGSMFHSSIPGVFLVGKKC